MSVSKISGIGRRSALHTRADNTHVINSKNESTSLPAPSLRRGGFGRGDVSAISRVAPIPFAPRLATALRSGDFESPVLVWPLPAPGEGAGRIFDCNHLFAISY